MKLTFVTGNAGKFHEATVKLAPLGVQLDQDARGYPEVQADTLEEVALAGIEHLEGEIEAPFFLEDAGLFVDDLAGFPGVYSSYAFGTIGNAGILRLLDGRPRAARFEAVIAYRDDAGTRTFKGACPGRIATEPRGAHGFGFDPIFVPDGSDKTFAELTAEQKEDVSHRGRALAEFAAYLGKR